MWLWAEILSFGRQQLYTSIPLTNQLVFTSKVISHLSLSYAVLNTLYEHTYVIRILFAVGTFTLGVPLLSFWRKTLEKPREAGSSPEMLQLVPELEAWKQYDCLN